MAFLKCSFYSYKNLGYLHLCAFYFFSKHISSATIITLCISAGHNDDHIIHGPSQKTIESTKDNTTITIMDNSCQGLSQGTGRIISLYIKYYPFSSTHHQLFLFQIRSCIHVPSPDIADFI